MKKQTQSNPIYAQGIKACPERQPNGPQLQGPLLRGPMLRQGFADQSGLNMMNILSIKLLKKPCLRADNRYYGIGNGHV